VDQVQRVAHRATQPVKGVHDDHIANAREVQQGAKTRAVGGRAGLLVDIDPISPNTDLGERLDLAVEVLLGRRHPRIPQIHAANVPEAVIEPDFRNTVSGTAFETP
jgi:hypothetical protein